MVSVVSLFPRKCRNRFEKLISVNNLANFEMTYEMGLAMICHFYGDLLMTNMIQHSGNDSGTQ
jgi:hypothetical protein